MKKVTVDLADRSYPILIGVDLLDNTLLGDYVRGRQVLIVTNETVAPLYLDRLMGLFPFPVDTVVLEDGEQYKNLSTLNLIFDSLLEKRHNRTTTLVALGGGVIGDMTGFAAACYQRGVDFIQIPTTLLAQVDSSVGGKTAVNHPMGKNMIGAFYQPKLVVADTSTLNTLPDREFRAGLAEVIKYGLIIDKPFFDWLEANISELLARDPKALEYAIERSCINKALVVNQDEREAGIRAILNLGHTFGHAIETFQSYQGLLHGEAVSVGMVIAAKLSLLSGFISESEFYRVESLLISCNLPVKIPSGMNLAVFQELMSIDKKVVDGTLKLILLQSLGKAVVSSDFSKDLMAEAINSRISS